jgi:hypothetical protein
VRKLGFVERKWVEFPAQQMFLVQIEMKITYQKLVTSITTSLTKSQIFFVNKKGEIPII